MARKTSNHERGPSQRQLRVAEEIRHVLANVLMRGELRDPALSGVSVTISEVRISPDLKNATVFSLPLAGANVGEVLKGLNRSAPFLRSQVGHAMALRYAPTLTFVEDKSFDQAHHIDELLKSERVARDLKAAREADDGEE
ncbi:MAG: 30S ribosome-binding factor RbfA [Alphaproteobacteria bacterium]|nr:30S ribosome-binding factor RbfA [Alphaproteobacteria bacterium]